MSRINRTVIFSLCFQPLLNLFTSSSGFVVSGNKWAITSASGVVIATRRLETEMPQTLDVDIPSNVPTPLELLQLWGVVQHRFAGTLNLQLWSSYLNYEDCSGVIDALSSLR